MVKKMALPFLDILDTAMFGGFVPFLARKSFDFDLQSGTDFINNSCAQAHK